MAQFLRPDGDLTTTGMTGGYAVIDEVAASDADFAYGGDGGGNVLEVSLSDPSATPSAGTTTVRFRLAEIDGGSLGSGNGNANPITIEVFEGATQRASTTRSPGGAWTTYNWTPDLSGVSDWNNLRLRFSDSSHGGNPNNRRAMGISWAEVETPDGQTPITGTMSAQDSGGDEASMSGVVADPAVTGSLAAQDSGVDAAMASAVVVVSASLASQEAGADSASVAGTVSGGDSTGIFATQEAGADSAGVSGLVPISGQLATADSGVDVLAGGGSVADPGPTGVMSAQEGVVGGEQAKRAQPAFAAPFWS